MTTIFSRARNQLHVPENPYSCILCYSICSWRTYEEKKSSDFYHFAYLNPFTAFAHDISFFSLSIRMQKNCIQRLEILQIILKSSCYHCNFTCVFDSFFRPETEHKPELELRIQQPKPWNISAMQLSTFLQINGTRFVHQCSSLLECQR